MMVQGGVIACKPVSRTEFRNLASTPLIRCSPNTGSGNGIVRIHHWHDNLDLNTTV